ncbi:MAG: Flp pilus assembly protein CpaB [Deltaproteobacteria bacterium]|nr:Flp pilus assembly protein CpaB [Deltaproteobacteria bacterium]
MIGLLVAGVATFLSWSYMKRFEDEASGGPRIMVLTVVRTLEPGSIIKDADIGERGIPVAYVESRAIRASDRQRIANLRVSSALEAQQILNWSDIVASNDQRVLSNLVQPGMRAVAVHTEGRSSALPNPGDRVDVISTVPQPGSQEHRVGVVLLQNVLVLGHPAAGPGQNTDGTDTVLSLTLEQSQLLAVAGDKAKLTLALRSTPDVIVVGGIAQKSSKDLADPPPAPTHVAAKSGPVAVGGKK